MKIRNNRAYALCSLDRGQWKVRRVVWGRLLARHERRKGEVIMRVTVHLDAEGVELGARE